MDPRVRRSPSPGQPLQQGYQLEDNPYGVRQSQQLDYPPPMAPGLTPSPGPAMGRYTPSDQLQLNAPVRLSWPHYLESFC